MQSQVRLPLDNLYLTESENPIINRFSSTWLISLAIGLPGAPVAQASDAVDLISQLDRERCDFPMGKVTSNPHKYVADLFQPTGNEKTNEYLFENELWVGVSGLRVNERYLIFRQEGENYVLVECIPFRAVGINSIIDEGETIESMTFGIYDRTPRGYDMFNATFTVTAGRRDLVTAEMIQPFLYEKGITEWSEPIEDPWYWSKARFDIDFGAPSETIWGFDIDLDRDGEPELGITTTVSHGTGGGEYAFFRRDGGNFRFLGYLGLRTMRVIPSLEPGGIRVQTVWRISINCGSVATYSNDGRAFHWEGTVDSCKDPEGYAAIVAGSEFIRPELLQYPPPGSANLKE